MPNKTLSIREDDLALWERAERTAKANRQSLSGLVATALARHLGETDTIKVQVYGAHKTVQTVQFAGRWLTDPDLVSDRGTVTNNPAFGHHENPDPRQWRAGIAETGRGRIAVYLHHWNYDYDAGAELHDFDSLDDAKAALGSDPRIPRETWQEAKYATTTGDAITWRDI